MFSSRRRTSHFMKSFALIKNFAVVMAIVLLESAMFGISARAQESEGVQSVTVSLEANAALPEAVTLPPKTANCESCGIKLQLAAWDDEESVVAAQTVAAKPVTPATDPVAKNAQNLAGRLLSRDEPTADVMARILRQAGFGIKSPDGTVIAEPDRTTSQNIAFDPWEVQGMTLMARDGIRIPLSDLSLMLSKSLLQSQGDSFNTLLLDGIRHNARSDHPGLRFWALFIAEMGRQSAEPYDLLGNVDASKVQLSPVQVAFVLRRLEVDLYTKVHISTKKNAAVGGRLIPASFSPVSTAGAPCTFTDTQQTIMDVNAKVATTGFKKLIGLISEGAGKLIGAASKVLSIAKVIMTYAALKADIQLENAPLVRTKNRIAGEQRVITAKFTTSFPENTQWLNCARIVLNSVGLDYSQPNQATPAKGASVNWVAIEGFPDPVEFKIADGGGPLRQVTDDNGMCRVTVQGAAQKQKLPDDATPIEKKATVRAVVNLQAANIFKDFKSVGGSILSPFSIPGELLKRMWPYSFDYTFPIRDWEAHYKFDNLTHRWTAQGNGVTVVVTITLSGEFKGKDPYKEPWQIKYHYRMHASGLGKQVSNDETVPFDVYLSDLGVISPNPRYELFNSNKGSLLFRVSPSPMMTFKQQLGARGFKPDSQSATVPVEVGPAK